MNLWIARADDRTDQAGRLGRRLESLIEHPPAAFRRNGVWIVGLLPVFITLYSLWYDGVAARQLPDTTQVVWFAVGGMSLYLARRAPLVPALLAPVVWATTESCSFVIVMSYVIAQRRLRGWWVVLALYTALHPVGVVPTPCAFRAGHVALPIETAPLFAVVLPALAGGAIGELRRVVRDREERLRWEADAANERARRAVTDERLRISRDLHDVVGQSVSRMTLHATALAAHTDETRSRSLATRIADSGARVLEDVHFVVGLLRDADDEVVRPTVPLDESVRTAEEDGVTVRATGLDLRTTIGPQSSAVLDAVAAEALHNVVKHAPGAVVDLVLRGETDLVRLSVHDHGAAPDRVSMRPRPAGGYGLAVATERVTAAGGSIVHGPVGRRGYRVRVELPR